MTPRSTQADESFRGWRNSSWSATTRHWRMATSGPPRNSTPWGMTIPDPADASSHGGHHVLDPGKVGSSHRRHPAGGPAPRVGCPPLRPPVLAREGRIGDHDVEALQMSPMVTELGVAQVSPRRTLASSMSWR